MEVEADLTLYDESMMLSHNQTNIAVQLIDVDLEECPEGPFPESSYSLKSLLMDPADVNSREEQIDIDTKPSSNGNLN